ncbi:ABC transporter permease [Natrinema salifodinae]|uniref:Putative ABC transport system permease protein n=1 Tax=Natrinema salifodinae TaxID=1202768 RepID=A0A1I0LXP9_9EURY|nr:ABC transporter permease [Natrinema salifodinae]SEV80538.1 putative ABC transport system permease protein [Natrinema salifodinae]
MSPGSGSGLSGAVIRAKAVLGLALAQLRRSPGRTALTVVAVTLAVLSVTVLASLGVGVLEKGERGLDNADRDIWVSREPVDPTASGTENPIAGAHGVSAELTARDDISSASPIAMYDIYVGTDPSELQRRPAVGVQETHDGFDFEAGHGFEVDEETAASPPPDEPERNEIVIDPRVAEELGVSVGDTIHVGTSRHTAATHEFTVIGISGYYSQYLGSPAMTVPLGDLQAVAGTSGTDRATFITADVESDADRDAVAADLNADYPEYDVRTSDQQVQSMLEERTIVLASGATLVGLAVLGGVVLTANLFALVAHQQRDELAALRAVGLSRRVLAGTIGAQGLVIGLVGGLIGVAATPLAVLGLNRFSASMLGFERLLQTTPEIYLGGFALAILVGTIVALVSGWRAGRYARIEHVEG